jgi:hypothetical protein
MVLVILNAGSCDLFARAESKDVIHLTSYSDRFRPNSASSILKDTAIHDIYVAGRTG